MTAPPYAIANAYSCRPIFPFRVSLQFLSGTVSYVLRIVYNCFFGITYDLDGLLIKPAMPKEFGNTTASFTYLGKKFTLNYIPTSSAEKQVKLNGKIFTNTKYVEEDAREVPFIRDEDMKEENFIEIEY